MRRSIISRVLALALVPALGCTDESSGDRDTSASPGAGWTVSPTGAGPVRVGMTIAEIRSAMGGGLAMSDSLETGCHHVAFRRPPQQFLAMVVDGRIARVEVRDTITATDRGARVGDTETRIDSLYSGQVRVLPHKYTDGHYLVVTPTAAADSLHRLVFETDGSRVTEYRAGRLPEVEWVEGCS